jgi:hypothetical protein
LSGPRAGCKQSFSIPRFAVPCPNFSLSVNQNFVLVLRLWVLPCSVYTRKILYRILCHPEIRTHNVHPREKIKLSQKPLKILTRLARHNTMEFSVDAKTYVNLLCTQPL